MKLLCLLGWLPFFVFSFSTVMATMSLAPFYGVLTEFASSGKNTCLGEFVVAPTSYNSIAGFALMGKFL